MFVKLASFICALSILSVSAYAQKNLKEAVVVFNGADTIKGFIDYKEWSSNPTFILFTAGTDKPTKRYEINDVSYFNVIGLEQYKRYTVKVSLDEATLSALGEKDTSSEIRTVFLKALVKGNNVSLFSYKDKVKGRFYLQEAGETTPVELLNTMYLLNQAVREEKQYRNTLRDLAIKYLPGNDNIVQQINDAGYYANEIESICIKLNGTADSNLTTTTFLPGAFRDPVAHPKQQAFRVFVGAGINDGALKFDGITNYNSNSYPFYTPVIDAGFDVIIKPEVGRIVLRGQLHYTNYKTDASTFYNFNQYTETFTFKLKQTNIQFAPQLLYNLYNQKQLKWFVGAGAGFNFSSYPLNQQTYVRASSTNTEDVNNNYLSSAKPFWINGCFSTGVDFNRLEVSAVYYPKASITKLVGNGVDNTSLQLRLNFFLLK